MCVCICICMCVCVCVCLCVCVCILYICVYVCGYLCICVCFHTGSGSGVGSETLRKVGSGSEKNHSGSTTLRLALQTDEIIAKLSLKKFVPIKKRNIDFSYAATDNINASLDI
jgi:hypothetical protein